MTNISKVQQRINNLTLARFGEDIYINGIPVKAVFADESFFDGDSRGRATSITIRNSDAKYFKKGDRIVVRDRDFVITYIPQTHEPMIDIEIKDA